jgi:exosortase
MQTTTTTRLEPTALISKAIWQAGLLVVLLGVLFYRILGSLVSQWIHDPSYSHGFFVLLFCVWMTWRERKRLTGIPTRPSNVGLLIIAGALGELTLGVLGAENFLSRTSLLFLVAGLVVYFRGWRYFYALMFPWAVLFLMIPLPAIIFNQVALPLQFQASRLASGMLGLVGVPVLREGNVIQLPSISLDVVEACSGLRSLVSLFTMAVFYGYLFEPRVFWRVLVILAAIPIAVVANGVRIMGSGVLGQYWSADKAEGFFHLFSGWVIFLVSLGLLFSFHKLLTWLKPPALEKRA